MRRICSSPPAHMGTRQAGQSLTTTRWLPRGLTDYNPRSATRSDVPGNRGVIIPRSIVKRKKACLILFSGKMDRSAQADTYVCPPRREDIRPSVRHGAFPGVARMDGNVPAVLVCGYQATSELQIFRRSLSSPGKTLFYIALRKNFLFFAKPRNTIVDC